MFYLGPIPPMASITTLEQAEEVAGFQSRSIRGSNSTVIDVCIIAETLSDAQEDMLRQRIADEIGSKTLQLSQGWGRTLVGLSFEESGLANTLISTLKRNGYEPSYIRLMRKEMPNL